MNLQHRNSHRAREEGQERQSPFLEQQPVDDQPGE